MLKPEFNIGTIVYLRVGDHTGVVTQLQYFPGGISYYVRWDSNEEDVHFECELTAEKPLA